MKKLIISVWAFIALPLFAQRDANIRIYPEQGNQQISKHIYGQFAEHLGSCIYGGLWVIFAENSQAPVDRANFMSII